MMAKAKRFSLVAVALAVFVFGGLLLWDWGFGGDNNSATCSTLAKDDPTLEASKIAVTGKFKTHNEGFIFIGDIIEFEIRAVYDRNRVEVKERSMRNLNLSPYKILSQSDVVTRRHSKCSEKSVYFTLQALGVDLGSQNRFGYQNSEGLDRRPEIEYAGEGLVRTIIPDYEAPYVVTVTGGEISRVSENAEKYPLPQRGRIEKTWQDTARFYLGVGMILGLIAWIGLPLIMNKRKRKIGAEEHIDPMGLFPELFQDGDSHERLVSAYFRLEEMLEESLREKASQVFSRGLTKEQEKDIILELRAYVKGRYGNDGLA